MDTSEKYQLMCKKSVEIQGNINENSERDIRGILQSRGIKQGDYMLTGQQRISGYFEHISVSHLDYAVVDNKKDELFYLQGREEYHYAMPFLGKSHGIDKELSFPIWRDLDAVENNDDPFEYLGYYLASVSDPFIWWLPRQDQMQKMFLNAGVNEITKVRSFVNWLDGIVVNPNDSLEILWLMFYMKVEHNKTWKESNWICG